MRRRAAPLIALSALALLLVAPRAIGLPDVPGDPTPPVVTPVITGTLGSAGWYTTNVTVNWTVTDPESIILSTTGCDSSTLTANTTGIQLNCTAESDGGTTSVTKTFKIDKTPPAANASPSRAADANGWYNHPLSVSFAATDGTSGVDSCSAPVDYSGPDTTGTTVAGTCRDQAGNTSSASQPVKYDTTRPTATGTARAPDANGWFNHAVTVTFQGSDGTSGIDTCTQQTYSGPDDPSVALGGTCTDHAGNVSVAGSFTLKYDETAPTASATPSRPADVNGWHNHALTVNFSGADATSGLDSCDAPKSYSGPDTATASIGGACRDLAGNVAPRSFAFKYDGTAPSVTATAGRAANANGWYNAPIGVSFAGTDTVSGVATCSAAKTYSGPDSAAADVTGNCTDAAGNVGSKALGLKYDATAPQATASPARPAGATGWYTAPVAVDFAATDATSGVDTCDPDKTYSGPDSATAAVGGACRDKAGNSGTTSLSLKYDATKPTATAAPSRPAGANGWYSAPVSVSFTGSDATSGLDTCDADKTYSGPDAASTAVGGACRDKAGNNQSTQLPLKYDATAPQVTPAASRGADANGWYNHALSVSFTGTDATAGVDTCDAAKSYSGPDSAGASVTGSCRDKAGNAGSAPLVFKYDATGPGVTGATPSRPPDADPWYNQPLSVQFQGADGMSGLASCTSTDYAGPDSANASVSGSCADRAGNTSATGSFALKYDTLGPAVTASPSRAADANGWYNHALSVSFAATDATSGVKNCDAAKTFSGPDAASTSVSGACRDNAGNAASGSLAVKYDSTNPTATATASRPANVNGWYGAPLDVSFAGSDGLSGLDSCDPTKTYGGPDSAAATVSGACRDRAGNAQTGALTVKYDATAPGVTGVTPSRPPDAGTWYNRTLSVQFQGADAMSGVESCTQVNYGGPDNAAASVTGSCGDRAGNRSASSAFAFKYDATAPAVTATPGRAADSNGWYNHPLSITFTGTDVTSGVNSCDAAKTFAGPDAASTTVPGACLDNAGNAGSGSIAVKYDSTNPTATATPSRAANVNGWYGAPLTVSFAGTDALSGLDTCDPAKSYSGPDSATASVGGICKDKAGNTQSASLGLKYDATAPVASAATARGPDANGWYNRPIRVSFSATDATAGVETCSAPNDYAGPDTAATTVTGSCRDLAGNTSPASVALKYDATAPTAAPTARAPDANGWFNHPVTVTFGGSDATSGVDTCTQQTYAGPDRLAVAIDGTCRDRAGNVSATSSFGLKYDATAPQPTATPSRVPGPNGWYNAPLSVSFAAADATSGVNACDAVKSYAGPDAASTAVAGACSDNAGNSATASLPLKYDATAPGVTATPARPAGTNGWYRAPVGVTFTGADGTSGVDTCDATKTYSGPDSAATTVDGTCRDKAGNAGTGSFGLKYDATAPQVGVSPSRAPDSNGWFNHPLSVSFAATDAMSGVDTCDAAKPYGGPDTPGTPVSGTCSDKAGNTRTASLSVKYDATDPLAAASPAREPDAHGWYNHAVAVGFGGTDTTSGIASCSDSRTYAGPDTSSVSLAGSCRDQAGNDSTPAALALKYDATEPQITDAVPVRAPDHAGWYNRPIAFSVQATDATSGVAFCPPVTYSGPDDGSASFGAWCADEAGNRGARNMPLRYDATAPTTTAAPDRSAESHGWYNRPFAVSYAGTDGTSGLESCSAPDRYEGPDSEAVVVSGVCTDRAGNVGLAAVTAGYDATAPTVTGAQADRPADANGWYNHPLAVAFQGADATSQVEECTRATYSGPDATAASVAGSCRDRAGNSSSSSFSVRYDGTAPVLGQVGAKAGNGTATITWSASADTALVRVRRGDTVVFTGAGTTFTDKGLVNGTLYRYTITAYDEAENSTESSVTARPSGPLVAPLANAVVSSAPRLAWKPDPKATYYNVQLWRKAKRILSLWPHRTSVQLPNRWKYDGRRYRLTDGRYRWYVFPGYGRQGQKRFGKLLGSSSFVVR